MLDKFEKIVSALIQLSRLGDPLAGINGSDQRLTDQSSSIRKLNAAAVIALAGRGHPGYKRGHAVINNLLKSPSTRELAQFYLNSMDDVRTEIEFVYRQNSLVAAHLDSLEEWLVSQDPLQDNIQTNQMFWSLFCPEAVGIIDHESSRIESLQKKRHVRINKLNLDPISDPTRQILFTSNVLLTTPTKQAVQDGLRFNSHIEQTLEKASKESQVNWYDHPIQIGVHPDHNEVLHGLRSLQAAIEYEISLGKVRGDQSLTCLLSISVTHQSLRDIAREYLKEEISRMDDLDNLTVYAFAETDTSRIVSEILAPAVAHYLSRHRIDELKNVFGVDGKYGRHYSFLKAVSAFWQIFIQPDIQATFKIDLDQVFDQNELTRQTGRSALEHFKTPLWGATGYDSDARPLELGMIAGALVNDRDIVRSIYAPDVLFPARERAFSLDERVFFHQLPQALSTSAEMGTRYNFLNLDGLRDCIQRIHVTGGTNGILIEALRKHRPFTPSFFGRAEDQAYLLPSIANSNARLAYLHADGLIMRHDKHSFTVDAIQAAHIGKLIGDYVRILLFSAYAHRISEDVSEIKDSADPFTGCFISYIPRTLVFLRFCLNVEELFRNSAEDGLEFVHLGARRIQETLDFAYGDDEKMTSQMVKERVGWDLYYDALNAIEAGLANNDRFALSLRSKAQSLISECAIIS